ncbi:Ig-like domain-containing protein [Novipirellula rosea]|uniref:Dockerin type I domain-containing protein n=1 Tax=Novipirellula rosea TaxID=1031540 RepID=A0ABP8N0U9_9BACT
MTKRRSSNTQPPKRGRIRIRRRPIVEHLGDRRVLAAITGVVFDDLDHSFRQEASEHSLPSRLVYLDTNNNAVLEKGEKIAVADAAGAFRFDGLSDGDYQVRLFNGTSVQDQLYPFKATIETAATPIEDALSLLAAGNRSGYVLTETGVEVADLAAAENETISVGTHLTKLQTLPDGNLLVIGGEVGGDSAWIVDPASGTVDAIDLSGSESSKLWSDIAIDGDGRGVALADSADPVAVQSLDASDADLGLVVSTTTTIVPADTTVITSDTGPRSVFAWAGEDGLKLSLWSNETASMISTDPIEVAGVSSLLDFDDESGLLVLRQIDGGVSVLDANADFASLHSFPEMTGPVTLDGARDLLMTVSPVDTLLQVVDLRDGSVIADQAIDLSTIGELVAIASKGKPEAIAVLGSTGVIEVSLRRADSHRVKIADNQDADPIRFALFVEGDNTAPNYESLPALSTSEDQTLNLAAPGVRVGASDIENDQFVIVQKGTASHGTVSVAVDGSVTYKPDPDFYGTDSVSVTIHDGVTESELIDLLITVTPVADPPVDVIFHFDPIPEALALGDDIGLVEVIDADGVNNHVIQVNDPRFQVNDQGMLIFIGGANGEGLNFEVEPWIPLTVSVTDPETETELVSYPAITVTDSNDPITGISPSEATVFENAVGDTVAELFVIDEDTEQFHILTVDDDRFVIDGSDLRLADGVSLNFEDTQEIVVNVTAKEFGINGVPFTQPITIRVKDLPEQPEVLSLVGGSVVEFESGAVAGTLTLDGQSVSARYVLTVDDTRFEVVDGQLKLIDDQFVEQSTQSEIQLTVTATDSNNQFQPLSSTFVIDVLENETPFHNDSNPYDVDNGGSVTAADALAIINFLNVYGPGPVGAGDPAFGYDVNADGSVTALDALLILNEINRNGTGGGTVGGGEQDDTSADGEQVLPPVQIPQIAENSPRDSSDTTDPRTNDRAIADSFRDERESNSDGEVPSATPRHRQIASLAPSSNLPSDFSDQVDETIRLLSDRT